MDFKWAMKEIGNGNAVQREAWDDQPTEHAWYIDGEHAAPESDPAEWPHESETGRFRLVKYVGAECSPFTPSADEIAATDWTYAT